ncbi:MAG: type II CRISPR RNA-guided endonuclease Cas9 [Acidobacteriia bacterium]|nr:type II CRISPR RNA-guided endonuclease Cas9 [Methyloceanibacter sp.]MCL6492945.1 type II CRISPR RNA-guided endonuclease Cas9 [Terriglobia bacterium]
MRTIWGFDLGVTSVGFAVLRWNEEMGENGRGEVVRLGVRVFPESREEKDLRPRNAVRRQKRLMRRQIRRRRWRRVHLRALLAKAGLLPGATALPPAGQDPYALRARGLKEQLAPHELGWALFHLLKRRGFQGSRKRPADQEARTSEEKDAEKEEKEAEAKAQTLTKALAQNGQKLAEYLAAIQASIENPKRRRGVGQTRKMVKDEFDALWEHQQRYYPDILTNDVRRQVEDIALAQRPTYFRRRTFGQCDLEPGEERALKAEWLTQRFEMLQLVNALRLEGGNQPPLDPNQRAQAIRYLERTQKPTWAGLRGVIGLPRTARFTHERGKKESVRGNATEAALYKALGADWEKLPDSIRDQIRNAIGQAWYRIEYKPQKNGAILEIRDAAGIAAERARFAQRAETEWGLSPEQAEKLAGIELPDGTARHSLKAMHKMLPYLEQGEPYMTALQKVYAPRESGAPVRMLPGPNPSELKTIEDPYVKRQMEKLLGGIRNPTVLRTLGELQKVANTLLRAYGKPDAIRLEFARDLKQSAEERREIDSNQRKREKNREKAREKLRELNKAADGREGEENVLRLLLWEEQGGLSPYSGKTISCADALSAEATEIDHIFPLSRSFDDAQANKVLCFVSENREKGNRTPYEWLNPQKDDWQHLTNTVWPRMIEAGWPLAKRRRCEKPSLEAADDEAFTNRQLVDTAFISRAAREYLGLLFGGGQEGLNKVQPVAGRATALLRRVWGIGLGRLLDAENGTDTKVRDDLRHHAIDALTVALTTPGTVHALSRYWQIRETTRTRQDFLPPWPGFREQVKAKVEEIVVSHRVQAKLSGPLHDETRLGMTSEKQGGYRIFVKRKPVDALEKGEIETIRDGKVRQVIENAVAAAGGDLKKALKSELRLPRKDGSPGPVIRRVRLVTRRQETAVIRTHSQKNMYADLAKGSLHHIAIYQDGDRVRFSVLTKREAAERARRGEAVVRGTHSEGGTLVMALHPNDVLQRPLPNGREEFVLVRKFSSSGQVFFKPLTMAREPNPEVSRKPGPLLKEGWRKVSIDPIGRVTPAR